MMLGIEGNYANKRWRRPEKGNSSLQTAVCIISIDGPESVDTIRKTASRHPSAVVKCSSCSSWIGFD